MNDSYLQPYRESVAEHGTSFGVTLWASPETQVRRFRVFNEMLPLTGRNILDAGCSRGDLAAYLSAEQVEYASYVGVDALEEVVRYASSRALPRTRFVAADFVQNPAVLAQHHPEVICISGTLNTMTLAQAQQVLESAWTAARYALMFNFLSDRTGPGAPPQSYPARRLDTISMLRWAMDRTWDVQFRQDYFRHGHDATILMRK